MLDYTYMLPGMCLASLSTVAFKVLLIMFWIPKAVKAQCSENGLLLWEVMGFDYNHQD